MGNSGVSRRRLLTGLGMGAGAAVAGLGACAAAQSTPAATAAASQTISADDELRRKIASLLIVGFRGAELSTDGWVSRAIREQGLGGVILFDRDQQTGERRNIVDPEQTKALISQLHATAPGPRSLIVSIDQEGGDTVRLKPEDGFLRSASQAEIGRIDNPTRTRAWAEGLAGQLAELGVDLNYAPVVDLAVNPDNPAIAQLDRSFSADPEVVVECATEEIKVHRSLGVRTTIKHFPGFGSATGNTDFEVVDASDQWRRAELVPFQRLISAGMADLVMVAHLRIKQLDPELPVSLSPAVVTGLLRGELGWDGPVVTDDMQAVALAGTLGTRQAVGLAVQAGVDLLVLCNQATYDEGIVESTVDTVLELVHSGQISEERLDRSVARVDTLRRR